VQPITVVCYSFLCAVTVSLLVVDCYCNLLQSVVAELQCSYRFSYYIKYSLWIRDDIFKYFNITE